MNKKEAEKKIKKLREEINLHNYKYYVENNPVISDYEFDQLLKQLEELETEFPELVTPEQRSMAKHYNFGVTYGMNPPNLKDLGSEEKLQKLQTFFGSKK